MRIRPLVGVATLIAVLTVGVLGASQAAARPPYDASITRIPDGLRARMIGVSWRPGCPVPIRDLRLIRLTYWGFDRKAHPGRIVVHRWYAEEIARVFRRAYEERFSIRSMRTIEAFGGSDRASMAADNTSGFNCRYRAGVCCRWSQHAYGRAIDLNPVENPYVWSGGVSPPAGRAYLDRTKHRRGMVHKRDPVWWAFRTVGWEWGGQWRTEKDYQHFSANGR
jgi:hypothetical protein